jgi:abhydrolase domain-containing protein 12
VLTSSNANIHILTIDYRGFGQSTGSPSEQGVISDGVALVNWALHTAHIPPERIVILGQSLGTAVASGVIHHFATHPHDPVSLSLNPTPSPPTRPTERVIFAGVILVASFAYLPTLLQTYSMGGLPILAPVRFFAPLRTFLEYLVVDRWNTAGRLAGYHRAVRGAPSRLALIHAINDADIPWWHSRDLFCGVVEAAGQDAGQRDDERAQVVAQVRAMVKLQTCEWVEADGRWLRLEVVGCGGHNRIVTYASVAQAVLRSFRMADGESVSLQK